MGAVVVQSKILSDIIITILCAVLVFQSTVVVSLSGYAIYIQPIGTAAATTTTAIKLSTVVKMLIDNAIQEFQSSNINNAMTYLQGAEQELLSSLPIIENNRNINNSASVMAQPLTILLLVKNIIQALDSGDYGKGQKYLNLAEQELGRNILDVSSPSLNPQTIIITSNATFNNNSNDNYSFFSTYTNTKYGIKLQYPHEWVIEADDYATGAAGQAGIQIASFYLPDVNNGLPFFRIRADDLNKEFSNLQKVSINQYLDRSLAHKNSTGFPGFNLIESDTNNKRLANNLAYTIVWTYTHPTYGMRKSIEIATILGSRGYFLDYTAATANFSKFLPVAEKMIESFQKTK
ncbi:MAG: hypothetical protein ACJ712_00610 [Nitrososphaeraceae archaeon]